MYGVNGENVVMCTNQKGNNEREYRVEEEEGGGV